MNEIKFQAYDKQNNLMFDVQDIAFNAAGPRYVVIVGKRPVPYVTSYGHKYTSRIMTPNFILRRYTGLIDKNGKRIYEGDIVVRHYYYDDLYPNTYDPTTRQKKVVSWINKPNYQLGYNIRSLTDGTASHLIVIGNIFQNKELLGVEHE